MRAKWLSNHAALQTGQNRLSSSMWSLENERRPGIQQVHSKESCFKAQRSPWPRSVGHGKGGASVIPGILGTCSTELSTLRWSRWMPFPREYPTSSLWNLTPSWKYSIKVRFVLVCFGLLLLLPVSVSAAVHAEGIA